ncbi:MAG: lysylphosphatidylglycerol synthase transmembrane domain-containing protein [Dehalococcoidia bacterium]|nr:lysylphosphatidylglycerol synthase transmembrane domain-containing protein [Dehalococcoidia bacterium]
MSLDKLRGRLMISLVLGLIVVVALMAYGDFAEIGQVAAVFQWGLIPLILGLTMVNYLLRFAKWHYYLGLIGAGDTPAKDSFLMFFSGLSMVVTPGKVGEWLKSFLLKETRGVPLGRSAPIVIAERLTDAVAMLALASGGLLMTQSGWQIAAAVLGLAALMVAAVQYRPLTDFLLSVGERLPLLSSKAHHMRDFLDCAQTLFCPRALAVGIALGLVSWGAESVAFYVILLGMGLEANPLLLTQAAFIMNTSILAGSLVMVPGGLGVAEGGIAGLSQLLLGMSAERAVLSTLIIRFCTLWFSVALGIGALTLFSRRLSRKTAGASTIITAGEGELLEPALD